MLDEQTLDLTDPSFSSSLSEFIAPTSSIIQASDRSFTFSVLTLSFLPAGRASFSFLLSESIFPTSSIIQASEMSLVVCALSLFVFSATFTLSKKTLLSFSPSLSESIVPKSSIIQASERWFIDSFSSSS